LQLGEPVQGAKRRTWSLVETAMTVVGGLCSLRRGPSLARWRCLGSGAIGHGLRNATTTRQTVAVTRIYPRTMACTTS